MAVVLESLVEAAEGGEGVPDGGLGLRGLEGCARFLLVAAGDGLVGEARGEGGDVLGC